MAIVHLTEFDDNYTAAGGVEEIIYAQKGNDSVQGAEYEDIIYGGDGDDFLGGDFGEDLLYGDAGNDLLDGGSANDTMYGGTGNDVLDGGNGIDAMYGGAGNDVYFIDDSSEQTVEDPGQGIDAVYTTISVQLSANVENLFALGARSLFLSGNGLANNIVGNDAPNVIDGYGGADRMEGKRGNDIYYVDSASDQVVELAGQGTDRVNSYITYTLGAALEDLFLLGSAAIAGTGNAFANRILGNSGANVINGGLGADTMEGGSGNDSYFADNAGDEIVEFVASGVDAVNASVSFTLSDNVENLTLTALAAIKGTGNDLNNRITGNAAANVLDGKKGEDVMTGGLGADTYFVDRYRDAIVESGVDVDTVNSTASLYILPNFVENLNVLADAGEGRGNALNNKLTGAVGTQTLDGGLGADDMRGGLGNDTYYVDNAGDVVVELAGQGADAVFSSLTYTLGLNMEYLALTGALAINGTGNALKNVIVGNGAANVLNGMAGEDEMRGGGGNDTFFVDNAFDFVEEVFGRGVDTVNASVNFTLPGEVENLNLTGLALSGTGNTLANRIVGNALANTLDGGSGNDILTGGLGNDTYIVNNTGDLAIELAGQGTDTVKSTAAEYTLGANVENLTLDTGAFSGSGNTLANRIVGNVSGNNLDGRQGADIMVGGDGGDFYVVDALGDVVSEAIGQGEDTVGSHITYTLGANVENVQLIGTAPINGTGNTLANKITGNLAANTLNGWLGVDELRGGAGNDIYFVDLSADVVIENDAQGIDTVNASASFALSAHVENLNLTGGGAINGIGNSLNNRIVGNAGANLLGGTLGTDILTGGLGADAFIFHLLGGVATITDFTPATESILLLNAGFGTLLLGAVPLQLSSGPAPISTLLAPTLLYDTDDGRLSIDLDGSGAVHAAIHFATLATRPAITLADFVVVP